MSRWWIWPLIFLEGAAIFAGSGPSQLSSPVSINPAVRQAERHNFYSLKKIINARLRENKKLLKKALKEDPLVSEGYSAKVDIYNDLKILLKDRIETADSSENKVALFNAYIKELDFQDVSDQQFSMFAEQIANLRAPNIHLELIRHIGVKIENLSRPWGEYQMMAYLNHLKNRDFNHKIEDFHFVDRREMVETDAYLLAKGWDSKVILDILPNIHTLHILELLKFAEIHKIQLPENFVFDKLNEYKKFLYNSEPDISLLAFQEALRTTKFLTDNDRILLFRVRTQMDLSRLRRASHFVFDSSVVLPRFFPLAMALREYYRNQEIKWEPWQEQMFSFFSGLVPAAGVMLSQEFCFLEAQPELFPEAIYKITSENQWNSFVYYVSQGSHFVDKAKCQEAPILRVHNLRIALFVAYKSSIPRFWTEGFFKALELVATAPHPAELLQVTYVIGNELINLRQFWGKFQMQIFLEHQALGLGSNINDWKFADNAAMVETNNYLLSQGVRQADILKILPHIRTRHYLNLIRFVDKHKIVLPPQFLETKLKEYQNYLDTQEDYTLLALNKGISDLTILADDDLKLILQVRTKADFERLKSAALYAYTSTFKTIHKRFLPLASILREFLLNKEETWEPWQEEVFSFFEQLRPTEELIINGRRFQKIELSREFCFIEAHPELGPSIMSDIETPFQFEIFKFYVKENAKLINLAKCQQEPMDRMIETKLTSGDFNLTPIQFAALRDARESEASLVELHKFDFLKDQRQYDIYKLMKRTGVDPMRFSIEISRISSYFQSIAVRAMVTRVKPNLWSKYFPEIFQVNSLLDAYAVCSLIGENRGIRGVTQIVQNQKSLEDVRLALGIENSNEFSVVSLMERFDNGYLERPLSPSRTSQILKQRVRHPDIVAQISSRPDAAQIAGVLETEDLFHCADSSCIAWGKKSRDYQCEACLRTGCVECGNRSHNHQDGCLGFLRHGYVNPRLFPGYANMERSISNICFFNSFLKMFAMMVATSPDLKKWLAMPYEGPSNENHVSVEESRTLKSILFHLIDDTIAGEEPKVGIGNLQRSLMDQLHIVAKLKGRAQFIDGFGSQQRDSLDAFNEVLTAIGFRSSKMQAQISTLFRVLQPIYISPVTKERHISIQLPISGCNGVQDCLDNFLKPDRLDSFPVLEQGYYPAIKFKGVTNRPPFLLLQLARFASEGSYKPYNRIHINQYITVSQRSAQDPRQEVAQLKYQLTATVVHSGWRESSGHYRAFLFDPKAAVPRPIEHNDQLVMQANDYSWKNEIESDGYLLSYKLVDVIEPANAHSTIESDRGISTHTQGF